MKTNLDILWAARAKIAEGWVIGKRGETPDGKLCEGDDPRAVKWCALGALDHVIGGWIESSGHSALVDLAMEIPDRGETIPRPYAAAGMVADYNNATSQQAVLELFDRAIAKLLPVKTVEKELVHG